MPSFCLRRQAAVLASPPQSQFPCKEVQKETRPVPFRVGIHMFPLALGTLFASVIAAEQRKQPAGQSGEWPKVTITAAPSESVFTPEPGFPSAHSWASSLTSHFLQKQIEWSGPLPLWPCRPELALTCPWCPHTPRWGVALPTQTNWCVSCMPGCCLCSQSERERERVYDQYIDIKLVPAWQPHHTAPESRLPNWKPSGLNAVWVWPGC